MLSPDDRELFLDALRPPEGTELDRAVGTTFTLDLQALLITPLAFALFDWAIDEDGTPNVVALLESLRRHADRTTVFCQAGQIRLPRFQPTLTFLEERVIPVTPPRPDRIFHPKAWILRFTPTSGDDGPVRYRVLCASRNLTFDRSWDTLLRLDGELVERKVNEVRLGPFIDLLRGFTPANRADVQADLRTMAQELPQVAFRSPSGFRDVRFHVVAGNGEWPFPPRAERTMVVSPFLAAGALDRLRSPSLAGDVLISRPETLDATQISGWEHRYVLSPLVVQPDALSTRPDDEQAAETGDLQGLHAKLYVFEEGDVTTIFSGSANATDAAFDGNIELLAEMKAARGDVGIDQLLAPGDGEPSFRDLLDEHPRVDAAPSEPTEAETVDRALEGAAQGLGALQFTATYDRTGEDLHNLTLDAAGQVVLPDEITRVRCWRVSAGAGHAVTVHVDNGFQARFGNVATAGITAFFAIELTARVGSTENTVVFVVVATLVGAPDGRRERVLTDLLTSRSDVLQYLLFLLSDLSGDGLGELAAALAGDGEGGAELRIDPAGTPLFESLLRALRQDAGKLDHVASLMEELRSHEHADELLPERLDEIWEPIWRARQGASS